MRIITLTFLLIAILQGCGRPEFPANIETSCTCADSTDDLCSTIPNFVSIPDDLIGTGYNTVLDSVRQPYFDIFSWQSFVALNWPSDSLGNPNPDPKSFKNDLTSPRVWEQYMDPDNVFSSVTRNNDSRKMLYMTSKGKLSISTESDGNALIDKNLNYVVFEERINPDEYKFIMSNGLNTQSGQEKYVDSTFLTLPAGDKKSVGAIELKASWRILTSEDDASKFYHQPATIYVDSLHTKSGKDMMVDVTVGLVGLHIIHKTSQKSGVGDLLMWSTFEHVDNVPDNLQDAQSSNKVYSFYNPKCIGCEVNTPPAPIGKDSVVRWADKMPYAIDYANVVRSEHGKFGTQVVRLFPVYYYTELVNKFWHKKLKGTVWENYKLIGTQWGKSVTLSPPFGIINAPQYLGNTTMETYSQMNSCITCHNFAKIAGKRDSSAAKYKSDLSFLFGHAGVKSLIERINKTKK